ncbi:MAG: V-type ATP synthase subunit F [Clostridia bacterium]|nr:V-type ATP synthase subunit F [Clostridia bacterium]
MVINVNVSWLKSSKDNKSFNIFKGFGMDVFEIDDLEKTDEKIKELINRNYSTIVLSNELAGFSEDIIKKYNKLKSINIIIAPSKKE